ncbi:class I SAM-dependent methyltransferase [Priestia endophytica]|uniref:class I SAM-dependent methyltransferase n=1 Tax=Priestia endophytica TaxID=135735 RepID=UPI00228197A4|nr:class I SAM-dependent methyltransferase [Priestia endophytica]MCY8235297.1 methyltransferase domain-containing protein [Priestia endophytica]
METVNSTTKDINLKDLLDLNYGFVRSKVLDFSLKLNLFDIVESTCKNQVEAISEITSIKKENVKKLLEALVYMGLLSKESDIYLNTSKYLCSSSKDYIGEHLALVFKQWDSWGALDTIMLKNERNDNSQLLLHMKKKSYNLAFPIVERLLSTLPYNFDNTRVLDYHCGEGEWTYALAKKYNEAVIDAFDSEEYKKVFNERMKTNYKNCQDNIKFISRINDEYDYIILSNFLRFYGEEYSKTLLVSLQRHLKDNGKIIIYDVFHSDEANGPSIANLLDLSMLVNTCSGGIFTINEACSLLKETGFQIENIFDTKPYPILIARSEKY